MPRTCQEWRAAPRFRRCGLFLYCSGGRRERDCAHRSHLRCEAAAARNHCRSWCGRWGRYGRCTAFYPEYGDDRIWNVLCEGIAAIVIASAEIFRVDAFQFVVPPAADAADFAFFALFRLNPVHILSGTADRREAPEGLSRILPGTLCRINLKIHRFISSPEGL